MNRFVVLATLLLLTLGGCAFKHDKACGDNRKDKSQETPYTG